VAKAAAEPDATLTVSFQNATLANRKGDYIALSYAWGTAGATARIHVKKGHRVFYKSVTPTLEVTLRRLQLGHAARIVWVDALCINQEAGSKEKNLQVMQMDHIYHKCRNGLCLAWGFGRRE
jgi:Heterokaryon incompatibility protein (HET)